MATIELIQPQHDLAIATIVRDVLAEFGAVGAGYACADPHLASLSQFYQGADRSYWVALDDNGEVLGGAGIGPLDGTEQLCELQKMYLLGAGRGQGLGQQLMTQCLTFARQRYQQCYLETLAHMDSAQKLYRRNGFVRLNAPLGMTGHSNCDTWYLCELGQ
ncbi:GNAT family N-acetyltransferase [Celerinatantimonas yamalensis]|uniref:GNAT family N-acetyltransferase n=1 Tax=Celerinatantimonas yamalensis TaxID=559956 RepID=A0ABW9G5B1_9GAMM